VIPVVILAVALAIRLIVARQRSMMLIWPVVRERMMMSVAIEVRKRDDCRVLEARGVCAAGKGQVSKIKLKKSARLTDL